MSKSETMLKAAKAMLKKIDTVEKAVELTGKEREAYLKALDVVYGDKTKRMKDMGFGDKTWYHGTNANIDEFDPKLANSKSKTGVPESSLFSSNPDVANSYANQKTSAFTSEKQWDDDGVVYPVKLKLGKSKLSNASGANWNDIYDKKTGDVFTTNDLILSAKEGGKNSAVIKNVRDLGEGAWADKKTKGDIAAVFEPKNIRSVNAAFDPRFKDSAKLMAGIGAGIPQEPFQQGNPLNLIKRGLNAYQENIAQPIAGYLQKTLTPNVQVPGTGEVVKTATPFTDAAINMAFDPVNLIPGAPGAAIGALQGISSFVPEQKAFGGVVGKGKSMYEYLDEDDSAFKLKDKAGKEVLIAKQQLSDAIAEKIRAMKPVKMAKGGKVPDYLAADYDAPPDLVSQAMSQPIEPYVPPSPDEVFQQKMAERNAYLDQMQKLNPADPTVPILRGRAEQHVLESMKSDNVKASAAQVKKDAEANKLASLRADVGVAPSQGSLVAGNGMLPADAIPIGGERASAGVPGGQVTGPVAQAPGMGQFDQIAKQMKGAVEMQSKAQQELAQQQIGIQERGMQALQDADKKYNETIARIDAEQAALQKSIMDQKIDPNRVWNSASTGSKVSAAIGMILGGLGSGLTGQPNAAIAMLDKIVSQDIDAQKAELGKKQTLYSQNVQKYQNLNQAYTATKLQVASQIQAQLQVAAAKAATPLAKAQAQQAMIAIDAQILANKQALAQQVASQQLLDFARKGGDTPEVIRALPEEIRKRWVPGFGDARSEKDADKANEKIANVRGISQGLDELMQLARKGSSLSLEDRARAQALSGMLIGQMRTEIVGPGAMNESEQALLKSIIANPMNITQLKSTAITSLDTVKKRINSNMNKSLQQFGLRPAKQLDFGAPVGKK